MNKESDEILKNFLKFLKKKKSHHNPFLIRQKKKTN